MDDIIADLLTYRGIPPPPVSTPPGNPRNRSRVFASSPNARVDDDRDKKRRRRVAMRTTMQPYPSDGQVRVEKRQQMFKTMLRNIDAMLDKKRATLTELRALRSDLASIMD